LPKGVAAFSVFIENKSFSLSQEVVTYWITPKKIAEHPIALGLLKPVDLSVNIRQLPKLWRNAAVDTKVQIIDNTD